MSFTNTALFEHSNALVKQSRRMKSQGLPMTMQDTVHSKDKEVCRGRGTGDGVGRSGCGVNSPRKLRGLDRGGGHLMKDGIYWSLEEMVKAVDPVETHFSLETQYGRMLYQLFRKEALQFLVECVTEFILVEEKQIFDGEIRMELGKSGFLSERYCRTLSCYDKSRNTTKTSVTGDCVLHEQ